MQLAIAIPGLKIETWGTQSWYTPMEPEFKAEKQERRRKYGIA
jgi:hypothetical protein